MDTSNWRTKVASAQTEDEKAEESFMKMAYSVVASKLKPLMQAPYRMGFEIVYKNLNSTRLVGVFVFRVGKQLIYAPVFFADGKVKSADLLYNRKTKRFRPASPEQAEAIINKALVMSGKGINPSDLNRGAQRTLNPVDMLGLQRKFASNDLPDTKQVFSEMCTHADTWLKEASSNKPVKKLLPEFLKAAACTRIPDIIVDGVCKATPAADAFVRTYTNEELFNDAVIEKRAAVVKAATHISTSLIDAAAENITLHIGRTKQASTAVAKAAIATRGYYIEDNRKSASYSARVVNDKETYTLATTPGVYTALTTDGDPKPVVILPMLSGYALRSGFKSESAAPDSLSYNSSVVVDGEGKKYGDLEEDTMCCTTSFRNGMPTVANPIAVLPMTDDQVDKAVADLFVKDNDLKVGELYIPVDLHHFVGLKGPMRLKDIDTNGLGNKVYTFDLYDTRNDVNSDIEGGDYNHVRITHGKIGAVAVPHLVFIKVVGKSRRPDSQLMRMTDLQSVIMTQGVVNIKVTGGKGDSTTVTVKEGEKSASRNFITKLAATCYLMCEQGLSEPDATACIEDRTTEHLFKKTANTQRLTQQGDALFTMGVDPEFGIPTMQNQTVVLSTNRPDYQSGNRTDSRIGDKMPLIETPSPEDPAADLNLETITPGALIEMAKDRKTRPIFDHGEVASLAKTTDSISLIESFRGDMELGLDRPGRILFLINWKPADFQQAYGAEDVRELETNVLAAFKSYGNCLLELEKRLPGNADEDTLLGSD